MSEIAKKSVVTFATRVVLQIVSIGGAIVIARTLGASGKGVYTYAITILAMLQMANAGQASALAWQYTKRGRAPATLRRVMFRVLFTFGLPIAVGLGVAGFLIPGQSALIAVAAAVPFALLVQSATGFFLADSDVRTVNIQQALTNALPVLMYVPLLFLLHGQLWVLFAVWTVCYVIAAGYTLTRLRKYNSTEGNDEGPIFKEQLKYGAQVSVNSTVAYLNFRIDVFLIMFVLGHSALGVYSIGVGIGEMLWQLSRPIATAAFGRIARGTEAEAAETTATCMRHSFALVCLGAIVIFFVAPLLIPLVYGKTFAEAGTVTRVLLPGIIAYSVMPTLATFFSQQLGMPRLPVIFSSLSTIICAGVTLALLPHFGILGGAFATSISYVTAFVAAAAYFVRRTRIKPQRLFTLSRSDLHPYRSLFHRKQRAPVSGS